MIELFLQYSIANLCFAPVIASVYLRGCIDAVDIPRYGIVGQCLVNPTVKGVMEDFDYKPDYAAEKFVSTTSYMCQSNMCNDDTIMDAGNIDCTPILDATATINATGTS